MRRGELYRVVNPSSRDPRRSRVFGVISRQALIESRFSMVVCAPLDSVRHGLSTQVPVGIDEGLRHDSCIHCDELMSLQKPVLTNHVGSLSAEKIRQLDQALLRAVGVAG